MSLHHLTIDGHPFAVPHTPEGGADTPVPQHRPPALSRVTCPGGAVFVMPTERAEVHVLSGRRVEAVVS